MALKPDPTATFAGPLHANMGIPGLHHIPGQINRGPIAVWVQELPKIPPDEIISGPSGDYFPRWVDLKKNAVAGNDSKEIVRVFEEPTCHLRFRASRWPDRRTLPRS